MADLNHRTMVSGSKPQLSGSLGPVNHASTLQPKDSRSSLTPSANNNPLSLSGRGAISSLPPSGKQPFAVAAAGRTSGDLKVLTQPSHVF